jgi:arylsulfatase A-like enzyme
MVRRDGWKKKGGRNLGSTTVLAALVALCALAAGALPSPGASRAQAGGQRPPNFLLILADDQAQNSFKRRYMPRTFRKIVSPGTRFTDGIAAPPLCCPDRAGILTGQYPHNHGVFSNNPGYGDLRDPQNTLPVWLHQAGYRTGFVGKFLNGYSDLAGLGPAPGFDRWFAFVGYPGYYNYEVSDNGRRVRYGHRRRAYSTDVLTRKARQFLHRSSGRRRPFFLWLAYNAPHGKKSTFPRCTSGASAIPPDRATYRAVSHFRLPRPPSFNEQDVSDKPRETRALPRLDSKAIKRIRHNWRCDLGAVSSLDDGVGRVIAELRRERQLHRTIVLYLSDNGYFFGEHRWRFGKGKVYEPSINVPFAARVPSAYRVGSLASRVHSVVSNQDVAPTLLDYASRFGDPVGPCAGPGDCRRLDGRSLAPLLGGRGSWPRGRGVLVEVDSPPTYEAIRTQRYVYSELRTGERELYDLSVDPFELRNVAGSASHANAQRRLGVRLSELSRCSGVEGRDPPTATPFCE